jgi:hypothetical protein
VQFTDSDESLDPNWHPEQIEIMDRQTNFKVRGHCGKPDSIVLLLLLLLLLVFEQ